MTSVNYALEKYGYPPEKAEDIKKTVGLTIEDIYKIFAKTEDPETIGKLCDAFHYMADNIMARETKFLPGSRILLEKLKEKGCRTGIVTSKRRLMVTDFLKYEDCSDLVDIVVGCDTVGKPKPDPEGILMCAEKLAGGDLSRIVYVGDSLTDARTGMNAGVSFIGVTTGTTTKEQLEAFPHIAVLPSCYDIISFVWGE